MYRTNLEYLALTAEVDYRADRLRTAVRRRRDVLRTRRTSPTDAVR